MARIEKHELAITVLIVVCLLIFVGKSAVNAFMDRPRLKPYVTIEFPEGYQDMEPYKGCIARKDLYTIKEFAACLNE